MPTIGKILMRDKLTIGLTITILTIWSFIFQAQAAGETAYLQRCLDAVELGGLKITQWTACWTDELIRQDKELNSTYLRIQKISSPELKRALIRGQLAWLAYRDAWCSYEELTPVSPGGSANRAACRGEVTITQIKRLKNSAID